MVVVEEDIEMATGHDGQWRIAPPVPEMGYYTEGEGAGMIIAEMGMKGEEGGTGRDMTWRREWRGRNCVAAGRRGEISREEAES